MHRQAREELAAAADRRLELLGRELDRAGLRRIEEERGSPPDGDTPLEPAPARVVRPAGRHARATRGAALSGIGARCADLLPDTFRGRVGLTTGPALLVVALVAVSLLVTVGVVLRTGVLGRGPDASTVPDRAEIEVPGESPTVAAALVPAASPSPTAGSAAEVTVDVAGRVRRPGVTTLPAGSRVVDALERAGGPRGRVDLSTLNLARVLVDGEQILVGRRGRPGGVAAGASAAAPAPTGGLVDLNTATAAQLDTLPGVGPVTAAKILDWRVSNGAFSSVDELLEVDGIGEKTLAEIAPHVTV